MKAIGKKRREVQQSQTVGSLCSSHSCQVNSFLLGLKQPNFDRNIFGEIAQE